MPKKRFGAEQIVTILRQIEVSMAAANYLSERPGLNPATT
jgi:hypothetical protein